MNDVVEVVRSAESVPRNAWSDTPEGRATRDRVFDDQPRTVPRNRRAWPALVAAAFIVVVAAAMAVFLPREPSGDRSPTAGPTREQMRSGSWSARRAPALASLSDVHAVRGGDHVYVVGRRADGAVGAVSYDPRKQEWTVLADSPLRTIGGFPNHAVAWSGKELMVLVTYPPVEAGPMMSAYDPGTRRWRVLPSSPLPSYSGDLVSAIAGDRWFVSGGASAGRPSAVFDVQAERWSSVPPPSLVGNPVFGLMPDGRLLAASGQIRGRAPTMVSDPPYTSWQVVGSPGFLRSTQMGMAQVGGRAFLVSRQQGGEMHVAAFDDGWEAEPRTVRMPRSSNFVEQHGLEGGEVGGTAVRPGAGGIFVGSKQDVSWYDPVGQAWTKLRPAPREVEIVGWIGNELLALTQQGELATYIPAH